MKCPRCGTKIRRNENRCSFCGLQIGNNDSFNSISAVVKAEKVKRRRKRIITVITIVFFLILDVIFLICYSLFLKEIY